MKPIVNIKIDDQQLQKDYDHRNEYNLIKRLIIEYKYNKAVDKKMEEKFKQISRRDM